jgi:DNA-binding response OmpR family regulator
MTAAAPQATVLVADDDTDVAQVYAARLRDEYAVRVAHDGQAALDSLDADVDVILLDRRMPKLSGDDVLARVRERDLNCRVAMVTGVTPDFDILDMGFDAYLPKPVAESDLQQTVETLVTRATYDATLQEFLALQEKRAILEREKAPQDLTDRTEYAELTARIDELQDDLDATLDALVDTADEFDMRAFEKPVDR